MSESYSADEPSANSASSSQSANLRADHEEDAEEVSLSSMNVEDVLSELQTSLGNQNSDAIRRSIKLARDILTAVVPGSRRYPPSIFRDVADFAVTRRDLNLWMQAISAGTKCQNDLFTLGEYQTGIRRACQVFGFSDIRSSLEQLLRGATLREAFDFLQNMPTCLFEPENVDEIDEWCRAQIAAGVKTMRHWAGEDDSELTFSIIRTYGIRCLLDMHCQVDRSWEMGFARVVISFLQEHRNEILSSPVNQRTPIYSIGARSGEVEQPDIGTAIDHITYRWMMAVSDYQTSIIQERADPDEYCEHVERIISFARLCFKTRQNHDETYRNMLDTVLELPGDETGKLLDLQIPTVRGLCDLFREFQSPVYSPPFAHFFCQVIERYTKVLLGTRTHNPQLDSLLGLIEKTFHCPCRECIKLNAFMKQIYVPQKTFIVSYDGYFHFKRQILSARELARFEKVESSHGLCVKVIKSNVFGEQRWEARIRKFREILAMIGEQDVIATVMGEKYVNLREAMEGGKS